MPGGDLWTRALAHRRGFDRPTLAAAHHERKHEPLFQSHPEVGDHDFAVPERPATEESPGKPHETRHRRFASKRFEQLVAVRTARERDPGLCVQQRVVAFEVSPVSGHRHHAPEHRVQRRRGGEDAGHAGRQGVVRHPVDVCLGGHREGEPGDAEREARVVEPVPEPTLARKDQRGQHAERDRHAERRVDDEDRRPGHRKIRERQEDLRPVDSEAVEERVGDEREECEEQPAPPERAGRGMESDRSPGDDRGSRGRAPRRHGNSRGAR